MRVVWESPLYPLDFMLLVVELIIEFILVVDILVFLSNPYKVGDL